jgi:C_GCAxxG_C_C family probable redox protein
MSDELSNKVALEAVELFKSGYHCSEAVLLSFEKHTGREFPDEMKRGMSAFVEGIGGAGCICGALNASIFILSSMGGRLSNKEKTTHLEKVVKEFHDAFRAEFKTACCRVIKKNAASVFGIGKYNSCHKTVDFCSMKLVDISKREGWI